MVTVEGPPPITVGRVGRKKLSRECLQPGSGGREMPADAQLPPPLFDFLFSLRSSLGCCQSSVPELNFSGNTVTGVSWVILNPIKLE